MIDAINYFSSGSGTVCLCGSTKFFFETMEADRTLTFLDWIVLRVGSFGHSFHKFRNDKQELVNKRVKQLHLHKIIHSDAIVVVTNSLSNGEDYIGYSTSMEMNFALKIGKPIFYFRNGYLEGETTQYPPLRSKFEINIIKEFFDTFEAEQSK